jgi:hypothetical protein
LRKTSEDLYFFVIWHECASVGRAQRASCDNDRNDLRFNYIVIDGQAPTSSPDRVALTTEKNFNRLSAFQDCDKGMSVRIVPFVSQ